MEVWRLDLSDQSGDDCALGTEIVSDAAVDDLRRPELARHVFHKGQGFSSHLALAYCPAGHNFPVGLDLIRLSHWHHLIQIACGEARFLPGLSEYAWVLAVRNPQRDKQRRSRKLSLANVLEYLVCVPLPDSLQRFPGRFHSDQEFPDRESSQ